MTHRPLPLRLLRRTAAVTVLVALCGGTLVGCGEDVRPGSDGTSAEPDASEDAGSSEDSGAPEDEVVPDAEESEEALPEGNVFEGDGYAFAAPKGWQDITDRAGGMSPYLDLGVLDPDRSSPVFGDNVNVLVDVPYPDLSAEETEEQLLTELRRLATDVQVEPRAAIDGEEAVHLSGRTRFGKTNVYSNQYAAYVDDTWYVVTFSHAPQTPAAERREDIATVLESWVFREGDDV